VREIAETSQEALGELRLVLFELRPPLLEEQGLAGALQARLQAVEARSGLLTQFVTEGDGRLTHDQEHELYGLAQEALNNVLKHAHAEHVSVRLALSPSMTVVEVADDGVGFDTASSERDGLGLRGMRERAQRLAGSMRVESAPGRGTRVSVEAPR
jgi:signal transduction histidine kinase